MSIKSLSTHEPGSGSTNGQAAAFRRQEAAKKTKSSSNVDSSTTNGAVRPTGFGKHRKTTQAKSTGDTPVDTAYRELAEITVIGALTGPSVNPMATIQDGVPDYDDKVLILATYIAKVVIMAQNAQDAFAAFLDQCSAFLTRHVSTVCAMVLPTPSSYLKLLALATVLVFALASVVLPLLLVALVVLFAVELPLVAATLLALSQNEAPLTPALAVTGFLFVVYYIKQSYPKK